jgi:HAD superfamily hydrolase (TIGR01509 family)
MALNAAPLYTPPMVRGILWDNDGVLVDTERLYLRATQDILRTIGIDMRDEDYVNNLMRGGSAFSLAEDRGVDEATIEKLRRERNDLYADLLHAEVSIRDGIEETLALFFGKVPMGIVSTSRRMHLDIIMDKTGLRKYFDFIIANEDFEHGKPHPEPYLLGLKRIGLPASACVAIEDSGRGVLSAKAAGLTCIAIPHDLTTKNDFSQADHILTSVRELPMLLKIA